MYTAYFDETGDDGYPKYSSDIFVLTSVCVYYQNWKETFSALYKYKQYLKAKYNFPVKTEIHTKKILLNKKPYRSLNWTEQKRLAILNDLSIFFSSLDIKSINVCINKKKIARGNKKYYQNILDRALTFNIQRIENDIKGINPSSKFMIISDEGRISSMRKTARKIQKINFIPSKYSSNSYRQEIKLLIEDPLGKESKESYFIQIADFISFFAYLKIIGKKHWHNRLNWFKITDVDKIINNLKPILNLNASKDNEYGFVIYPK